jgi:hypothetical protein
VAQKLPAVKYAAEAAEETIMYPYTEVMDGRHIYRTFKYENSPMWRIGGLTPAGWRALREDITFTVLELPEPLPEMVRIIRPVSSGIIVDDQYPDDTMFAEIPAALEWLGAAIVEPRSSYHRLTERDEAYNRGIREEIDRLRSRLNGNAPEVPSVAEQLNNWMDRY